MGQKGRGLRMGKRLKVMIGEKGRVKDGKRGQGLRVGKRGKG